MDEPAFANEARSNTPRDRVQLAVCGVILVSLMYTVCYVLEMFKADLRQQATGAERASPHARP